MPVLSPRYAKLVTQFLEQKQMNDGATERTRKAYGDVLARLAVFATERQADPLDLDADALLTFCGPWLHKAGVRARSRVPYVACVRGFYRWLASRREIPADPASEIPYPKHGRKMPSSMTLDAFERLMWQPDFSTFEGVRDAAMIAVLGGCGLRVGGLIALNVGDLVPLEIAGQPRLALRPSEKGDHERLVPVPREADLLLRLYLEHPSLKQIEAELDNGDRVLFVTTRNRRCPPHEYHGDRRRFTGRGVRAMIERYGKAADIPRDQLHPHALRHLYGTEFAESDVGLDVRQKLLGHADPKTTTIYDNLALRRLTRTVDTANPLGKINTPVTSLLRQLAPKGRPTPD